MKVLLSIHFKLSTYLAFMRAMWARGPPKDVNPKVEKALKTE